MLAVWVSYIVILTVTYFSSGKYYIYILFVLGALNFHVRLIGAVTATPFEIGYYLIFILIILERLTLKKMWSSNKSQLKIIKTVILYWIIITIALIINIDNYENKNVFLFRLLDPVVFYFVVFDFLIKTKNLNYLINAVVFSGLLIVLIGIAQFILGDPSFGTQESFVGTEHVDKVFYGTVSRISSTTSNPNALGSTILLTVPIITLIKFDKKLDNNFKISAIILFLICILLSGSRTAYIVLFLLVTFYFIMNIKFNKIMIMLFTIVILINLLSRLEVDRILVGRSNSIVNYQGQIDANKRVYHWNKHLSNIGFSTIIIGTGIPGISWGGAHNNYIGYIYYGGVPLLLVFLIIIGRTIILNYKNKLNAGRIINYSLFSFVIYGLTNEVSFQRGPPMYFWALLAISTYIVGIKKQ